jgi:uncharacterized Zn-binding protein involved in type VI secretion
MSSTVIVNDITAVHKLSDGTTPSAPPDVCKTPSPGGPVPVPYVNVAESSKLVNGSVTVTFDGQSIALKDSMFLPSTGDEAGSLGGVTSGVFKGAAKFSNYSMDVMVEGRNVARLGDPMTMNGNAPNTTGVETQPNLAAEAAAKTELCFAFCMCDRSPAPSGDGVFVPKMVSPFLA